MIKSVGMDNIAISVDHWKDTAEAIDAMVKDLNEIIERNKGVIGSCVIEIKPVPDGGSIIFIAE